MIYDEMNNMFILDWVYYRQFYKIGGYNEKIFQDINCFVYYFGIGGCAVVLERAQQLGFGYVFGCAMAHHQPAVYTQPAAE
ncbi:hypothetical protein M5G07_04055 [Serratia symbiotica]|nr:hypothetical protein [Serratia symbiotica]